MDEDFESTSIDPWQHIHDLFKGVTNEAGESINISQLQNRFAPALFDSSSLTILTASPTNDRNIGYLAFYQSFSTYTINHYNTLSTSNLEDILVQTTSQLPITKIATFIGLDDNRYDSCYTNDDRLLILLGVLVSFYGSSTVNSFMHPLFENHLFNEIQLPQPDQGQEVMLFESLIRSRGAMNIYYQQLEATCPQTQYRWECTISYQLGPTTSMLLHYRTGKNKKQAKLRVLYDIYNYYAQGDFFLPGNVWNTEHPHCQSNANDLTITLSIPTEKMHEYDDDKYENITLRDRQQQSKSNAIYVDIPADAIDTDDPDQWIEYLTKKCIGDPNDTIHSPQASPLPAAAQQQYDGQLSESSSTSLSPLPLKSDGAPSPKTGPGSTTTVTGLNIQPSMMKNDPLTTTNTNGRNSKAKTMDEPREEQRSTTISDDNGLNGHTKSSQPPTDVSKALLPATEDQLNAKAKKLVDLFTVKERLRLNDYKQHLSHNPYDAKGCLLNLASKIEHGKYYSSTEHVQLGKAGSRAHYVVTVRFGIPKLELVLARGHTKKSSAEAMAAMAVFDILLNASNTANHDMKLPFLY